MIIAAIDLGTVTSRLLLGEVVDGQVQVLLRDIAITNLGEGLTASGVISDAAMARLMAALLRFKEDIANFKTKFYCADAEWPELCVKAVATSAMRDAANATVVLDKARSLGIDIEVISGSREAELSFLGTLSGFGGLAGRLLSIDVGGGSTEVIYGAAQPQPYLELSHSFNIGSRRVTEMFLTSDPPLGTELVAARAWIDEQIARFFAGLPAPPQTILAVAGTATSAITIRDGIADYESSLVHGQRLRAVELSRLIATLAALPLTARQAVPGLHPDRAPVIIGGLITLQAVLAASGQDSLVASDTDILQGIILQAAAIC